MTERSAGVFQKSRRGRFFTNLGAFVSRFIEIACDPKDWAFLIIDLWLLVRSIWTGKRLGPDLIYPLLSITKRPSGYLARLILKYSRKESSCKLCTSTASPTRTRSRCVAVINLDDVHPQTGYSTQVDFYGILCVLIYFHFIVVLVIHVLCLRDLEPNMVVGYWGLLFLFNLDLYTEAIYRGEGILTLIRPPDTFTSGCAVLLDQDFTLVLNGTQGIVEAIGEGGFVFSQPSSPGRFRRSLGHDSLYRLLEYLCYAGSLTLCVLCLKILSPSAEILSYIFFFLLCLVSGVILPDLLRALFSITAKSSDYPIRSAKFIDTLGHPRVRKWEFDDFAAAVTFQSLILCRGIVRPVRSIDALGLLDMFIPDQRDVWKTWKERVADRIVHETDINFAPTLRTFGDERQQQLKDLLDQAQFGYDTYMRFYDTPGPHCCGTGEREAGDT